MNFPISNLFCFNKERKDEKIICKETLLECNPENCNHIFDVRLILQNQKINKEH